MPSCCGRWGASVLDGWGEDVLVELEVLGHELVVKPLPKVYSLEEWSARITDENRHGELDGGSPRGAEHW